MGESIYSMSNFNNLYEKEKDIIIMDINVKHFVKSVHMFITWRVIQFQFLLVQPSRFLESDKC